MADVARRAGVSRTLASLIFNGKPGASIETHNRVLEAAEELGYHPDSAARLLARGRSRTVGVLIDVEQPFQADLIGTVYDTAEHAGYEVLLSATAPNRDERKAIEALLSHRCEGLILLSPLSDSVYLRSLAARSVVTIVGRRVADTALSFVRSADWLGIGQSINYLVGQGHRDIVHVDGGTNPVSVSRRRAYVTSMNKHGLSGCVRVVPGAHDESAGSAAARTILESGTLPTAVLAGNDRSALGLMDAFTTAGVSIPQDISIVGYDDTPLSRLARIDLTTVRQDSAALARTAMEHTITRLDEPGTTPKDTIIEPHLVIRGTTGPARATG